MYKLAVVLVIISATWTLTAAMASSDHQGVPGSRAIEVTPGWRYFAFYEESDGRLIGVVGGDYSPVERNGVNVVPVPGIELDLGQKTKEITGHPDLGQVMSDVDAYRVDAISKAIEPRESYVPESTPDADFTPSLLQLSPAFLGIVVAGATLAARSAPSPLRGSARKSSDRQH